MAEHLADYTKAASAGQSAILGLAQRGMLSSEMPEFAIWALSKWFRHPAGLNLLPEPVLMTTLARLQLATVRSEWARLAFEECLGIYRQAESSAGSVSVDLCRKWSGEIRLSEALMFSETVGVSYDNARSLSQRAIQTFAEVGMLSEGFIQLHLRELLGQSYFICSPSRRSAMEDKTFGDVVQELITRYPQLDRLLKPPPWNLELHHWRNISQHRSWRVQGSSVLCEYGKAAKRRTFSIPGEELASVRVAMENVMLALGAARAVFLFDRIDPLVSLVMADVDQVCDPVFIARSYSMAAASYGFRVQDWLLADDRAVVVVQDVTDKVSAERMWFVVSFAYHLCKMTGKDAAEATYVSKQSVPLLRAHVDAASCSVVAAGDWLKLIPSVQFTDLQTGEAFTIPCDQP